MKFSVTCTNKDASFACTVMVHADNAMNAILSANKIFTEYNLPKVDLVSCACLDHPAMQSGVFGARMA